MTRAEHKALEAISNDHPANLHRLGLSQAGSERRAAKDGVWGIRSWAVAERFVGDEERKRHIYGEEGPAEVRIDHELRHRTRGKPEWEALLRDATV